MDGICSSTVSSDGISRPQDMVACDGCKFLHYCSEVSQDSSCSFPIYSICCLSIADLSFSSTEMQKRSLGQSP